MGVRCRGASDRRIVAHTVGMSTFDPAPIELAFTNTSPDAAYAILNAQAVAAKNRGDGEALAAMLPTARELTTKVDSRAQGKWWKLTHAIKQNALRLGASVPDSGPASSRGATLTIDSPRNVGRTIWWAVGIAAATILGFIVISAIVSAGTVATVVVKSQNSSNQVGQANFDSISQGMSQEEVRGILGDPESTDVTNVQDLTMECWYYGILALGSGTYQFCFENGALSEKSRIGG